MRTIATASYETRTTAAAAGPSGHPTPEPNGVLPPSDVKRRLTKRPVDEQELCEGIARLIVKLGERAGETDASVIKDMLGLKLIIDEQAKAAARSLVDGGPGRPRLSWQTIADELGVSRQAVHQLWGRRNGK